MQIDQKTKIQFTIFNIWHKKIFARIRILFDETLFSCSCYLPPLILTGPASFYVQRLLFHIPGRQTFPQQGEMITNSWEALANVER